MAKRTIGTILMVIGFLAALGILMFVPDNREMSVIGFAIFAVGCMLGQNRPPRRR